MNFMYVIVVVSGLLSCTVVKSESMFDYGHKVGMCGSRLISMVHHVCKYYRYTLEDKNSGEKNIEKETILNVCCAHTCLVKDIVQYCQDESLKRVMKSITGKPLRTELQLETTTSMIPSTSVATHILGKDVRKAPKTYGGRNMAYTVKPMQPGQQKVDTHLSKSLDIRPKDSSDAFINIKFDVLHEKYTDKFEY